MSLDRLPLAQKQLNEVLPQLQSNTTLGMEETSKHRLQYMMYTLDTEDGDSYVLGLQEIGDKGAQTTLDKLEEAVSDISNVCSDSLIGKKII